MLTVTDKARAQIALFLKNKQLKSIRIMIVDGCPGPKLELGLDQATTEDKAFEIADVTYLVNKNLMALAQTITIDFTEYGFDIYSSLELGPLCSGCGTPNSRCGH